MIIGQKIHFIVSIRLTHLYNSVAKQFGLVVSEEKSLSFEIGENIDRGLENFSRHVSLEVEASSTPTSLEHPHQVQINGEGSDT